MLPTEFSWTTSEFKRIMILPLLLVMRIATPCRHSPALAQKSAPRTPDGIHPGSEARQLSLVTGQACLPCWVRGLPHTPARLRQLTHSFSFSDTGEVLEFLSCDPTRSRS